LYFVAEEIEYDEAWPSQGKVVFRNVTLTYDASLGPVLHNTSFIINPGEKVGKYF
jgi:ABC-type multidrug transport system fused ATPase/permease subunit